MPELRCSNCGHTYSVAQFHLERFGSTANLDCPSCRVVGKVALVIQEAPLVPQAETLTEGVTVDETPVTSDDSQPEYAAVTAVNPTDPSKGNKPVKRKRGPARTD